MTTTTLHTAPAIGITVPWQSVTRDAAALFFAVAALLTLVVSLPATYAVLAPFHAAGNYGWVLAVFAVAVFELGAVGAKLITLAVPQWALRLNVLTIALLLLTTCANFAHGLDLFSSATLAPSLKAVRDAGATPLVAFGAAALFPALLYTWLAAFVARCKMLATHADAARRTHDAAATQRDALASQLRQLAAERDALMTQLQQAAHERDAAQTAERTLHSVVRQIETERDAVAAERDALRDAPRALPDADTVTIGERSYSLRKVAAVFGTSDATVRRKLKQIEGE